MIMVPSNFWWEVLEEKESWKPFRSKTKRNNNKTTDQIKDETDSKRHLMIKRKIKEIYILDVKRPTISARAIKHSFTGPKATERAKESEKRDVKV